MLQRSLVLVAVALLLGAGTASAVSLPAGSTALLSGGASLFDPLPTPVAASEAEEQSISADGRYVAFMSHSDGLMAGDDDRVRNVYRKDMATGAVALMSRADGPAGEASHSNCEEPAISDDGQRVAFVCAGRLDPGGDQNAVKDVYVRWQGPGTTTLASRSGELGPAGNDHSYDPSLSANGEDVVFTSTATNLGPDTAGDYVYRRHLVAPLQTAIISREPGVGGKVITGFQPSVSDDGQKIAFVTTAKLVAADTNGLRDVYVRDMTLVDSILVSREAGSGGKIGNGESDEPAIAGNGSAVAFASEATNFDNAQDRDDEDDIYWRSFTSNNTALVSVTADGAKGIDSRRPSIDSSGHVVGFVSRATALDPGDDDQSADAYVKNVISNDLQVASRATGAGGAVANAGAVFVAISGDGTKAVSSLTLGTITPDADPRQGSVFLRDLVAKTTASVARPAGSAPFVNAGGLTFGTSLSADGRFIALDSDARALGVPDGAVRAILVRDRVTGAVTLASRTDGFGGAPFTGAVFDPSISADGRRVAFTAAATRDADGSKNEVWVRDLVAGRTFLASRADGAGGAPANDSSHSARLDADGSRVLFESYATNLGDGDTDNSLSVHVRDLDTNRTFLASRADGANGATGAGDSDRADINGDGTVVSFLSASRDLVAGDGDSETNVFVRDLAKGTTRLLDATPLGVKANEGAVHRTAIDDSGTRVAFSSRATNLPGATQPGPKVFVRDLAANTLTLVSRADGPNGDPAQGVSGDAVISPDGGYVAFWSADNALVDDPVRGDLHAYRRDLVAGRTALVSRRDGPSGAATKLSAFATDISANGACVSFAADESLFGQQTDFMQSYLRVFNADCGDPPRPAAGGASGDGAGGAAGGRGPVRPRSARDTVAPVLSAARLNRRRFRVARKATALSAARTARGTTLSFRSSEAATLSVVLQRKVRRRTKRAGALTRRIKKGAGRIALTGRLGRKRMPAGRYRVTLTARDAAGNRSKPVTLTFTIVRG